MKRSVLILKQFGYALAALSLFACTDTPGLTEHADTFHQRLTELLHLPEKNIESPTPKLQYPRQRALAVPVERTRLDLLDGLSLSHCELGQLIAENNSALGRLKEGFSKYHTDLKIVSALKVCIEHSESASLKNELQTALTKKESQLEASLANAFAYDEAFRKALSVGNSPLPMIHVTEYNYAVNALERFTRILERWNYTKKPDDLDEMMKMLGRLARSSYLPSLFRTMLDYSYKLEQITAQLPELSQAGGCLTKPRPERAVEMRNLFNEVYIKVMQKDLAELIEQHQRLLTTLDTLQSIAPQPSLKKYISELTSLSKKLTESSVEFVRPWQKFFNECQFTPGVE